MNAPTDDKSIDGAVLLWRRIPPWHVVFDTNENRWRPSSAAFADDPDGEPMSVILGNDVHAVGRLPETALAGHEGFALAAIPAQLARDCGTIIVRDPLPEEPCHALVIGSKPKAVQRRWAKQAIWIVQPKTSS